jgi:hypothetical protein
MKIINWLRSRNNLILLLEASTRAGIDLAKENAGLRIENELLKRELKSLKEGGDGLVAS